MPWLKVFLSFLDIPANFEQTKLVWFLRSPKIDCEQLSVADKKEVTEIGVYH